MCSCRHKSLPWFSFPFLYLFLHSFFTLIFSYLFFYFFSLSKESKSITKVLFSNFIFALATLIFHFSILLEQEEGNNLANPSALQIIPNNHHYPPPFQQTTFSVFKMADRPAVIVDLDDQEGVSVPFLRTINNYLYNIIYNVVFC